MNKKILFRRQVLKLIDFGLSKFYGRPTVAQMHRWTERFPGCPVTKDRFDAVSGPRQCWIPAWHLHSWALFWRPLFCRNPFSRAIEDQGSNTLIWFSPEDANLLWNLGILCPRSASLARESQSGVHVVCASMPRSLPKPTTASVTCTLDCL